MGVNKIILFVGCILAISVTLLIFRPWNMHVEYRIRYLRDRAVEVAKAVLST
ncbi:MAG: hypothetical protein J7K23_05780 [Thermoproteales archaeon]|nr:hypothetical protein [Thermoproteales archaeon]